MESNKWLLRHNIDQGRCNYGERNNGILSIASFRAVSTHNNDTTPTRNEHSTGNKKLLSRATSIRYLPPTETRAEAYEQVGRYIVDQCDVLIALWDGKPAAGRGGTAEIVQYARDTKCPLIWIHESAPGQVTVESGRGLDPRPFQNLDDYNSESTSTARIEKQLNNQSDFFLNEAKSTELPFERFRSVLRYFLRPLAHVFFIGPLSANGPISIHHAESLRVAHASNRLWKEVGMM